MNPKIPPAQRKAAILLLVVILFSLAYFFYLIGSISTSSPGFVVEPEKVIVLILSAILHIAWELIKKRRPDKMRIINQIHKIQFVVTVLLISLL